MHTGDDRTGTGRQRAESFLVMALLWYRCSQLAIALVLTVQHGWAGRSVPAETALLVAVTVWSAGLFQNARTRGWFSPPLVWLDCVLVGCVLPAVVAAATTPTAPAAMGWALRLGSASVAVAGVAAAPVAVGATVVVLAVHVAVQLPAVSAGTVTSAGVLGHVNSLVWSAVIARVCWTYLHRQGDLLDRAVQRAVTAEATRARYAERVRQHRALHDTVLSTLTALAGPGLDANSAAVRGRCARDAAYLRRLLQRDDDEGPGGLGDALERAVQGAESLGLQVHAQYHELPPDLPAPVVVALGQATTEALNNVSRHAGSTDAWLTATGSDAGVVVTVVDAGRGFRPTPDRWGLGLRRSVHDRMLEVGGRARVDGAPEEGVCVELRWPR